MKKNIFSRLLDKFKNNFSSNKNDEDTIYDYAFSTRELDDLNKINKKKIEKLKESSRKSVSTGEVKPKLKLEEIENILRLTNIDSQKNNVDAKEKTLPKDQEISDLIVNVSQEVGNKKTDNQAFPSYINLSDESLEIIMKSWKKINNSQLDKDILRGKQLLQNDKIDNSKEEVLKYIREIRKKYEVMICYFIGFNNEKKGILGKTMFSNNTEDEWQYLNHYIKVLERIRGEKK